MEAVTAARPMVAGVDWAGLYVAHGPRLLRYLRRMARDDQTAADLLQDAFARAMTARKVPADGPGQGRWLYRIATNLALDHLRRSRRFRWLPFSGDEEDPREMFIPEIDLVRQALRSLPPDQVVVLVLRDQEAMSRAEIAEVVGISEAAVKSRLFRARAAFAHAYQQLDRGDD